ncbi:hypothetical protein GYA37_03125 [candidate division WWE3 bacterium]|uniref:Uncharacterized protein n=1 Tax=candidate division WWE3 bacterium TaxID=2053526 RepID=A0A7X9E7P2_UNCKA|nr:hypothetical protein [candidate division WWE3 bacterium]
MFESIEKSDKWKIPDEALQFNASWAFGEPALEDAHNMGVNVCKDILKLLKMALRGKCITDLLFSKGKLIFDSEATEAYDLFLKSRINKEHHPKEDIRSAIKAVNALITGKTEGVTDEEKQLVLKLVRIMFCSL